MGNLRANAKLDDFKFMRDEIMGYFNFEKVHKAMQAVNWTWLKSGESRVPTLAEIITEANDLLSRAYFEDISSIGTGGFHASYDDEDGLTLEFTLDAWTSPKKDGPRESETAQGERG